MLLHIIRQENSVGEKTFSKMMAMLSSSSCEAKLTERKAFTAARVYLGFMLPSILNSTVNFFNAGHVARSNGDAAVS